MMNSTRLTRSLPSGWLLAGLLLASEATGPTVGLAGAVQLPSHTSAVYVLSDGGDPTRAIEPKLERTEAVGDGTRSVARATTAAGSVIEVDDRWTGDGEATRLSRDVTVRHAAAGDRAFGSGITFDAPARSLETADVFVPGVWYGSSAQTPASGLIRDVGQADFLIRDDRCALPLVGVRDRATGRSLTLAHDKPDGATIAADTRAEPLIDARLRFGSIGLRRPAGGALRLAFRFPGTEGEQTSIGGFRPGRRAAERLHPLVEGATQHYELTLRPGRSGDLAEQLRAAWRPAFRDLAPAPVPAQIDRVYAAGIDVLHHYAYDQGAVSGVPFGVKLPGGEVSDRSLQIGFIGQQTACASYLIDEGLRSGRPDLVGQGERIVSFWARDCIAPSGVPRSWFDVDPKPGWRAYESYLRSVCDGGDGALRAWQVERAAGRDRPAWMAFCRSMGDWLLATQNDDGSFFRSWRWQDGRPASRSKTNTLHPVRFLVDLACATGDPRYRAAAERAATWSLQHDAPGRYAGGTPDNPDVIDKEAGWIAMESYLALHDVTGERRWLDAAVRAADYTETWIYAWNVPMPVDATLIQIPRLRTTAGAGSLIATGHSGVDLFLAFASLGYARLALATGDEHFADVARLLQANTAQFVDVDGSLGYAQPGLCVEAFSLAGGRRGRSVATWLPWGTSAVMEPMARCRDAFGTLDVAEALRRGDPAAARRRELWTRTRGFASLPPP